MTNLLTVAEVARALRTSTKNVRGLVKRGELPASYIGGRFVIDETDVRSYIDRQRVVPRPPVPEPDRATGARADRVAAAFAALDGDPDRA